MRWNSPIAACWNPAAALIITWLFYKAETHKISTTSLPEYDILSAISVVLKAQNAPKSLAAGAAGLRPGPRSGSSRRSTRPSNRHRRNLRGVPWGPDPTTFWAAGVRVSLDPPLFEYSMVNNVHMYITVYICCIHNPYLVVICITVTYGTQWHWLWQLEFLITNKYCTVVKCNTDYWWITNIVQFGLLWQISCRQYLSLCYCDV